MEISIRFFSIALLGIVSISCNNSSAGSNQTSKGDTTFLTAIIGEKIHYYSGELTDSAQLKSIPADPQQLLNVINKAKTESGVLLVIGKPSWETNSIHSLSRVCEWMDANKIAYRKNPELSEHEMKWLKLGNPPNVSEGKIRKIKLFEPKPGEKPASLDMRSLDPRNTMIVVIYGDEGIYMYTPGKLKGGTVTDYKNFREILAGLKQLMKKETTVVIKPTKDASYKNTVNMLDEMLIADISKYSLVDIDKEEQHIIDSIQSISNH